MPGNPWDVLPAPDCGDASREDTFAAVGRALTQWEMVEVRLFWLFRALINVRGWDVPAERAFGSIATSRGRIGMIRAAADAFIFGYEGRSPSDLKGFLDRCDDYAARRNEIAHGIVSTYEDALIDAQRPGFVLSPPRYNSAKNRLMHRGLTLPRYIYSSKEIDSYCAKFKELFDRADALVLAVQICSGRIKA